MKKIVVVVLALSSQLLFAQTHVANYPSGKIQSEGAYVSAGASAVTVAASDGETRVALNQDKEGKWNYWYESGKMSAEEFYTNGTPVSIWKTWYESGKQSAEINFSIKKATYFYENGHKQSEGSIASDKSYDGKWTGWHEDGTKSYEGNYSLGKKEGDWNWYDTKGKLITKQTYKDDTLLSTQKF